MNMFAAKNKAKEKQRGDNNFHLNLYPVKMFSMGMSGLIRCTLPLHADFVM